MTPQQGDQLDGRRGGKQFEKEKEKEQAGEWDDVFHVLDNVENLGKGRNVFKRNMDVITIFRLVMVKEL